MGKGAALCLNGPYILSHFGPYSDGGTGKFSHCPCRGTVSDVDPFFGLGWGAKVRKIPAKKFGALRAQVTKSFLCLLCVRVWEDYVYSVPPAKNLT